MKKATQQTAKPAAKTSRRQARQGRRYPGHQAAAACRAAGLTFAEYHNLTARQQRRLSNGQALWQLS